MAAYGYARVSTEGQSLSAQLAQLNAAGCKQVFREKISGARSDRKQLARLVSSLTKGDVVIVTRLDRLARSTRDLLNLLASIAEKDAEAKGFPFVRADAKVGIECRPCGGIPRHLPTHTLLVGFEIREWCE